MGTQNGNLHKLSVTTSRMSYFILQADTGTCFSHSYHMESFGEVLKKMKEEGHGR